MLVQEPTDDINDSTGAVRRKISIKFSKAMAFCWSLYYKSDESYFYVNKKEIWKFKTYDNIRWYNFCLGCKSKDFTIDEQSGISLDGTVYDFSVDHSSSKKEDTLDIQKYLMVKNNMK